jgi:signal transduction histidine kinase
VDEPPDDVVELIAQVTHELRTPLTPIRGYLHTLQRRDAELTTAERQEIYAVLLREEGRLEALVSTLLEATTPDRVMSATPEVLDWPRLVFEQADLARVGDPARSITVTDLSGARGVLADAHLAVGVLANLLANALAHSPEGSPVEVVTNSDGDAVVTTISDHGPGVPPADRARIFERFVRVGEPRATQKGVGLGLFIARRSTLAMGGAIWCEETPGGGARFSFRLPAAP